MKPNRDKPHYTRDGEPVNLPEPPPDVLGGGTLAEGETPVSRTCDTIIGDLRQMIEALETIKNSPAPRKDFPFVHLEASIISWDPDNGHRFTVDLNPVYQILRKKPD